MQISFDELMRLEKVFDDHFTTVAPDGDYRRMFGGLLAAQALAGAAATVDDRPCHSLHLLFMRSGLPKLPMEIKVDRLRDGRSFSARHVRISQNDHDLVTALCSFHGGDDGPAFSTIMPDVPPPESLSDQLDIRRVNAASGGRTLRPFLVESMLDIRAQDLPADEWPEGVPTRFFWFRSRRSISQSPLAHQFAIAFASDLGLVHVGVLPHRVATGTHFDLTSLDHTIWFHRPALVDDWLLYVQQNTFSAEGRGLSHGAIFSKHGERVASVAQEILIRYGKTSD